LDAERSHSNHEVRREEKGKKRKRKGGGKEKGGLSCSFSLSYLLHSVHGRLEQVVQENREEKKKKKGGGKPNTTISAWTHLTERTFHAAKERERKKKRKKERRERRKGSFISNLVDLQHIYVPPEVAQRLRDAKGKKKKKKKKEGGKEGGGEKGFVRHSLPSLGLRRLSSGSEEGGKKKRKGKREEKKGKGRA